MCCITWDLLVNGTGKSRQNCLCCISRQSRPQSFLKSSVFRPLRYRVHNWAAANLKTWDTRWTHQTLPESSNTAHHFFYCFTFDEMFLFGQITETHRRAQLDCRFLRGRAKRHRLLWVSCRFGTSVSTKHRASKFLSAAVAS